MYGFVEESQRVLFSREILESRKGTRVSFIHLKWRFFKDEASDGPQWSEEQLAAADVCFAGLGIGQTEVDILSHTTQASFEILDASCLPQDPTLLDMKIEFGVDVTTKEIVLADVTDNDC